MGGGGWWWWWTDSERTGVGTWPDITSTITPPSPPTTEELSEILVLWPSSELREQTSFFTQTIKPYWLWGSICSLCNNVISVNIY